MRIFNTFPEALNEIKRDLKEMAVEVFPSTMQDKKVEGVNDFIRLEISDYCYRLLDTDPFEVPSFPDLSHKYLTQEFDERMYGILGRPENPGRAWTYRTEVWEEFLHTGKFSYTYGERLAKHRQVRKVIDRLKIDPESRQGYITIWEPEDSLKLGTERVPCSLGWHIKVVQDKLCMTYFMRSCDYVTHFSYDVNLSLRLLDYIAGEIGYDRGSFTHFISSLHIYKKDVEGVF